MSLQNPAMLLWALPLMLAVIALYLLKMKRREVRVPATFLWPDRVEEIRANSLFQRLRFSWLLVLQLIALALAVFCLGRPQTRQSGLVGEVTVLVIDGSASMGATDVKPSRFEEAKRLAVAAVESAKPGDRVAILEAGPSPRVVFPLGSDTGRQVAAIRAMEASDTESDVGEALRLAASLVGNFDGARIVLLSDGDFDPVTDFSRGKAALIYRSIGEMDDNLAISALGTAETPRGRQLYCGVRNTTGRPSKGTLTLLGDGKALDSIQFTIGPNGSYGRTVAVAPTVKVFEAKLDAPDFLKADNYAATLAQSGSTLRVLLVSPGDLFLERALALDPRVTLDRSTTLVADAGSRYDVVVFDGAREQPTNARGVLTLGAAGASSPVASEGDASKPMFVAAEKSKLLEGVDLRQVFVDHSEKVQARPEGKVLATLSVGPMVVSAESKGQRKVYLSFSPLQSDFPLQIGFPIFVANCLDYLGSSTVGNELAVRTGAPFSMQASSDAVLTTPDGRKLTLKPKDGAVVVRDTNLAGRYRLSIGGRNRDIYATLQSDRESTIKPAAKLAVGGGEVKASQAPSRFTDFWRPLLLLCLLVLAFEWWVFARKS